MSLGTPTRLHTARACRVRSNYNYSQSIALIFSFISRPDGVSYPDMMCKPSSLSPSYFQHHPSKMARFRQKYMSWRGFHSGQGTKRWKREIRPLPCWFFIIIFLGLRIFLCATVSSLTVKGTTYWGRSASGRNEQERVELFFLCNPEKVDPQAKTRCKRVEHTLNSTQTLYLCATKINVNLMTIQTNTHWLCCVTWYVISLFFNKCAFSILFYVAPRILVGASSNRILKLEYAPNSVKSPCPQNS